MDDPIITTQAAARLLGVSVRTAQTWIEQNAIESWKTPGGHRRVRRSAVLELMSRVSEAPRMSALVFVHASQERLEHYCDVLAELPECCVLADSDIFSTLLSIGSTLPGLILTELARTDWDRFAMLRRVTREPGLGHTRIVALSELSASQIAQELGSNTRVSRLPVNCSADDLRAAVRAVLADEASQQPDEDEEAPAFRTAPNEMERVKAVTRSGLLDTAHEEAFDRIVRLTGHTLGTPIALITLLAHNRQWFKARWGIEGLETPRLWAFCNHTILQKGVFVVEDATEDPRFRDNPYVVGEPHVRFYAGVPITDYQGFPLGSLCVIDRVPRGIDQDSMQALTTLGELASDKINLRIRDRQLKWSEAVSRSRDEPKDGQK
jgi:excisionase family DNA binding protein